MHRGLAVLALCAALSACAAHPAPTAADARVSEARRALVDPDRTAWNFQHMAELFPTRTISRRGPVSAFERDDQPLGGVRYVVDGAAHTVDEFLARSRTAGIVVLHRGRLVFERYRLGAGPATRFTSWSVAKSFVSTLVGVALSEGRIASVDDPIVRYVPELAGTGYDGVTLAQALQMSSGVAFSEVYSDPDSDVVTFISQSMLANQVPANEIMKRFPRAAEPGTVFNYSTGETQVLGWALREATGVPLATYLERTLWSRLGMEHDATWVLDREGAEGVEMAGCCLNAALRDWARFGELMLDDGVWRGERVLPAGWVAEATVPDPAQDRRLSSPTGSGYGYQWWSLPGPGHAFSAEGVFGQFIYVDPARRVVIAKASAWPDAWSADQESENWAAFRAIAEALDDATARP